MGYEDFKDILAVSCTICTIFQFLSGTLVCQKFVQKGSTGDASAFPFISGALSTSLWLRYGFLIEERSIILVNTVGATLFYAYVLTFYIYSIKKSLVLKQFIVCLLFLILVLIYAAIDDGVKGATVRARIGMTCCVLTILFFAAPLTNLLHVLKLKSTESMPFPLILAGFVNSIQWFLYGLLINDTFVQIPNFLGAVLSALQLSLFCVFPKKYKQLDQI